MSVAIPLTKFGEGTYGDLVSASPGKESNDCFYIYHNYDELSIWFAVAYDNFRIYKIK